LPTRAKRHAFGVTERALDATESMTSQWRALVVAEYHRRLF
jgi:hypothetical protein